MTGQNEAVKIRQVGCKHPVVRFPYYHLRVDLQNKGHKNYTIDRVIVNGEPVRDTLLYIDRKLCHDLVLRKGHAATLIIRGNWRNNDEMKLELRAVAAGQDPVQSSAIARTPSYGGYWDEAWKHYISFVAVENKGVARFFEPVHVGVAVYADHVRNPEDEVRVVEVDPVTGVHREIPSQVYGVSTWKEMSTDQAQPSTTFDVAFLSNIPANSAKVYLVFYDNSGAKRPTYESDLTISGEGYGLTIDNSFYSMALHPKGGSINEVYVKQGANKKFEHKLETNGSVHWNPGIYVPPRPWMHISDWDPPENYTELRGPIFLMTQRWGKLPQYPEANFSCTYIFYAHNPYVIMTSSIDILEDISVQALRNGEYVINKELANEVAWKTARGNIKKISLDKRPAWPDSFAVALDNDIHWVSWYNNQNGAGMGFLNLESSNFRRSNGLVRTAFYGQYINKGHWYYICRSLVFPFGSQNPQLVVHVPKGSTYYEKQAIVPYVVGASPVNAEFEEVDRYYNVLSQPLQVHILDRETDKRVPAVLVSPVLAEEFKEVEEGLEKGPAEFTRFRIPPSAVYEYEI